MLDQAYLRADRILDRGQQYAFRVLWFFLPEPSLARDPRFEHILASRFLSDAGQQALAYGALIAVVRDGGSAFQVALVGIAALIPPALLGLYGGTIADSLPKRVALAMVYNLQALLCFLAPTFLGTGLPAILALIFAVNALGQVSGPSESSVLPLIASEAQLATAASLVNLASTAGTAVGTALLAPVIVRAFGVAPVMYVSGILLLLAASRVFDLPTAGTRGAVVWRPNIHVRATLAWLLSQHAVAIMVVVGVMAGTANIVVQTLAPRYVQSVLHVDAADTVYVFAPSVIGLVVALAAAPLIMKAWGERLTSLAGFLIAALALFSLGLAGDLAAVLDAVNPIRLAGIAGISLGERLRTAAFLALPLGFGLTLTTTSIQTYVNRRVPLSHQGRAFALQSSLKSGAAIVPLATLGAAASAFGVERVMMAAPFVLLALAYGLIQISFRFAGLASPSGITVLSSFWETPEVSARAQVQPPAE